jgi:hypothetical protein
LNGQVHDSESSVEQFIDSKQSRLMAEGLRFINYAATLSSIDNSVFSLSIARSVYSYISDADLSLSQPSDPSWCSFFWLLTELMTDATKERI